MKSLPFVLRRDSSPSRLKATEIVGCFVMSLIVSLLACLLERSLTQETRNLTIWLKCSCDDSLAEWQMDSDGYGCFGRW